MNNQTDHYILKIRNLSFFYEKKNVLNNINISIKNGEVITILGPNGGGKTSLVRILIGIYKNYTGSVEYIGKPTIGYLPQHFNINNIIPITVEYFLKLSCNQKRKKLSIEEILSNISISKILSQQMSAISAGELQLVLLAKSLMIQPDLIILDEPVSFMDINAKNNFYQLINKLIAIYNLTIIMTSHDLHSIMSRSDRIICINRTIHCEGHSQNIIKDENFTKMFPSYTNK